MDTAVYPCSENRRCAASRIAPDLPLLRGSTALARPGPGSARRAFPLLILLAMWRRSIALFYSIGRDLSGEMKRRTKFNRPIKNAQIPAGIADPGEKPAESAAFAQKWFTGANDGGSV